MLKPTVIIFDVNETLLDLAPLKLSVGKALGGREDLLPLWFSTMLHHSLVETLTKKYHSFGEIGAAALMMVAETQLRNAGLTDLFEKRFSVEGVKKYKPHPDTYRMVLDDLRVKPEEAMMVAAHGYVISVK
ncbi:MAG: HAD hydrolase-like protein [Gemmatimonadetes bacterium]|jgi:2-haloacid dehalogenase|nr:HAD hydrolase-like protein [Gemmatimonadota bacterium]